MVKFTLEDGFLCVLTVIVSLQPCPAYREIFSLLDEVKDLTQPEINALRPLFEELQMQYDLVNRELSEKGPLTGEQFEQEYQAALQEFEIKLNTIFPQKASTIYNTSLPTVDDILGEPNLSLMTQEQRLEFLDLQGILQDTLNETQMTLNELTAKALNLETHLLRLSKPQVVTLIFKALRMGYKAAGRLGRAAYCTYSHLPQLNTSLHTLYEGVDCYLYTTSLIVKIQNETYRTVKTVRQNIFELAAVYKKVAKQNSLMGKIVTVILNVTKIARSIFHTIHTAKCLLESVENQLPAAAKEVHNCSSNVVPQIPFVLESVSNVTECLLFKDNTKISYDFVKSEEEYNKEAYNGIPDIASE